MAHYDLEEQEQIDSIKTWWKMYGNLLTGVVTIAAVGVVAWQGWHWYQRNQTIQASNIYGVLEQAILVKDSQRVKAAAGELAEKYGSTPYAPLGALIAAKLSFDASDLKTAQAQLSWVVENAKDELKDVARLRLAAVLLDEQAYDEALKQLGSAHAAAFDARFAELKGDVLVVQGRKADAKVAYREAMSKMEDKDMPQGTYRQLLEQKVDGLGGNA